MRQIWQWCVVAMFVSSLATASAGDFFFKDGDVIVMVGDSITEQRLYSNYVEMWTITRFPKWKLTFRNAGIGGDRSVGGDKRFARDVLLHKPTAMTVDFGMNDGSYRPFDEATFKPFMEGLQGMANQAKVANLRTAWITPQPLDKADQGPTAMSDFYNQTLEKFSDGVRVIAEKNEGLFVDQFHPYVKVLDRARAKDPKYERITGGDAVHPGPPGQTLMAASILKGMSFPSLVSSAEIDATSKKVVAATNCTIENIEAKEGGLTFSRLDGALPFFPHDAVSIVQWDPILEELNDYRLKVTGLAAGKYDVRLGGVKIAELTAEQLAAGANIASGALTSGPIAEQAKAVKLAVENKNNFNHDAIFRGVVLTSVPDWIYDIVPREMLEAKKQTIIQDRLNKLADFDAEVVKSIAITANAFEIVPVK